MSKIMVDPPSGWRYGFPRELPEDMELKELLEKQNYPKDQMELALKYTRFWIEKESKTKSE